MLAVGRLVRIVKTIGDKVISKSKGPESWPNAEAGVGFLGRGQLAPSPPARESGGAL